MAACLDDLHADRIGHGVRAVEDPAVVKRLAAEGVTCEVCPSSNVALGIAAGPSQVPLRALFEAGVPVALGADDPLLFGPRLTAQYEIARHAQGFTDAELADLARMSVPPRPRPSRSGRACWPASTAGSPHRLRSFFQPNGPWYPRASRADIESDECLAQTGCVSVCASSSSLWSAARRLSEAGRQPEGEGEGRRCR